VIDAGKKVQFCFPVGVGQPLRIDRSDLQLALALKDQDRYPDVGDQLRRIQRQLADEKPLNARPEQRHQGRVQLGEAYAAPVSSDASADKASGKIGALAGSARS